MRKVIILGVIIILFTLAIALFASIFWITSRTVVSKQNQRLQTSQEELLSWDLKSKQSVTGSFDYSGGNGTTAFWLDDPKGVAILNSVTVGYQGKFTVTASTNGNYTLHVKNDQMASNYLDYKYSISSPILGFDLIPFISIVIAIGVVLALVIAFSNLYLIRNRNKEKQS